MHRPRISITPTALEFEELGNFDDAEKLARELIKFFEEEM